MNTTTTGDADAIHQLRQAIRRHHGDTRAWAHVGQQLAVQRTMLDPRYDNRSLFARARVLPAGQRLTPRGEFRETAAAKLAYDLERGIDPPEGGPRRGFSVNSLRIGAEAYAVILVSFAAALDGGHLEPAPPDRLTPAQTARLTAAAIEDPPPAVLMSGVLSSSAIAAAAPHATEILIRLRDLAVAGIMRPSGRQLFPDSEYEARIWDANADELPDEDAAWLVAGLRVQRAPAADRTVLSG